MASLSLGAATAASDGPLSPRWLAVTVLGIFAVEVGKNASGEIFDFATDAAVAPEDRSPFSGGKRVLVDRLLNRRQTAAVAAVGYAVGAAAGLAIAMAREPAVLGLGLAGFAAAYFYNAPPLRLSYRGLGEITVGLCYGPGIACGTYLVQRGTVSRSVLWLSLPLGLLIAAFLWISQFPDFRADAAARKRNWVVRLGRPRAARVFALELLAAFGLLAALPLAGLPKGVWWGGVGMIPAAMAARAALSHPEGMKRIVPAQGQTLLSFLLLALGSSVGLLAFPKPGA